MSQIQYLDLHRADYMQTLLLQQRLVERLIAGENAPGYLLLVEHDPPVITLGRRSTPEQVRASADRLSSMGIEIHRVNRGGGATYHGPGQLVAYPIFNLQYFKLGLHEYLRKLEEVLIRLLGDYGINAGRIAGLTGVWVADEKIASIGIAVRKWISYHGLALNVRPNMSHFDLIIPCGITDKRPTSMRRLVGDKISVQQIKKPLIDRFADVFGYGSAVEAPCRQLTGA